MGCFDSEGEFEARFDDGHGFQFVSFPTLCFLHHWAGPLQPLSTNGFVYTQI